MKKLILIFLTLITIISNSYSQTPKMSDTITSNLSKTVLYANALSWLTNSFYVRKEIDISNKEGGLIICKGFMPDDDLRLIKITIQVKDGKYRYNIYIFNKTSMDILMKSQLSFPIGLAKPKNGFNTYAKIDFKGDSVLIRKIYSEGPANIVNYDSENKPFITNTTKQKFIDWKASIDSEYEDLKKEALRQRDLDNLKLKQLIEKLKSEMSKEEF